MNEIIELEEKSVSQNGYNNSSGNALRHGILSRHIVLQHENVDEYNTLILGLKERYDPDGPIEEHLIEELAGCIWRKQRVLMAESSAFNAQMHSIIGNERSDPAAGAVPWKQGMGKLGVDFEDIFDLSEAEVAQQLHEALLDMECTEKASELLDKGGRDCYQKVLKALQMDSKDWWLECVAEDEYKANSKDLETFIADELLPLCESNVKKTRFHYQIKQQTLGESLPYLCLNNLSRYETFLDRKFERTLAMLIKLKSM